jgi:hypothetical protein
VDVLVAREPRPVRVAAGPADAMAADAELLARAAVATSARHGIDARLCAMLTVDPARWMRATRRGPGDVLASVAVDAGALGVTGRAEPRVGARLRAVTSRETGAMKPGQAHLAQGQLPGKHGDRAHAVARRALPLGVTARAEIALARRAHTVLTDEVSVVNEVVVRRSAFGAHIDVATVAVPQRPLVAVLVAPEAARHLRQDRLGTTLGDLGMAANAVATNGDHVTRMLEAKLRARELRRLPHVRLAVAVDARSLVVGLLVAAPADGVVRKMQRSRRGTRRS